MRVALITLCLIGISAGVAPAQWWGDNFDTNTLTGWTLDKGAWTASNMRANSEARTIWQYATRPDHVYQDCSVECDVFHPGTGLMFAGVALRVNDPTGGSLGRDLIMVKLQGSTNITQMWLYNITAAGASSATQVGGTAAATGRVRLTAIGTRVLAQWDSTGDGNWDKSLAATTTVAVKPGPVALDGYNGGMIDNFVVYSAALLPGASSPAPNPGNTVEYDLGGPANDSYQAAFSFGRGPLPLSATRAIPLTPDNLFFASASNGLGRLFGTLDANGNDTLFYTLPNLPALVGVAYYTAYVTFDTGGLTGISNDVKTVIT